MQRRLFRTSLPLAFVAAVVIASPSFAQNLLTNPGFEVAGGSYTGWFTFGSGVQLSLPAGDNIIRTGVAASKTFGGFPGCPGTPAFNVGGYGQAFTPTAGKVYQLSGYSYVSSADPIPGTDTCNKNRMLAKVVFFNAASGGNELASNEVVIGDGHSITNQWRAFSVSAPAPAGALRVEALLLYLQPGCDGGAVYVDDTSFSASTPPAAESNVLANPSFTAPLLAGWTTFGNALPDARAFAVRTPTGAAKLFSTFVGGSDSGMYQTFATTPGSRWKLEVYSMTTCQESPISGTNDNIGKAKIVFRDLANNDIGSSETVLVDRAAPLGTWTRHVLRSPAAPAGTVSAQAYILYVAPSPLLGGAMFVDDVSFRPLGPTDVAPGTPATFALHQNVPNPFNPSTRIDFDLAKTDAVDVSVYDVAGRWLTTLLHGSLESGPHTVAWDGRTADGSLAAAGIYRSVLTTSAGRLSRNMVLVK